MEVEEEERRKSFPSEEVFSEGVDKADAVGGAGTGESGRLVAGRAPGGGGRGLPVDLLGRLGFWAAGRSARRPQGRAFPLSPPPCSVTSSVDLCRGGLLAR